jgi:hypothetical protein
VIHQNFSTADDTEQADEMEPEQLSVSQAVRGGIARKRNAEATSANTANMPMRRTARLLAIWFLTIELRCAVDWRPACHRKLGDRLPRHLE